MSSDHDRPRERMFRLGGEALTAAELIALILGTGTRSMSASQLAAQVLEQAGGLVALSRAEPGELSLLRGLGEARAARLSAAFHLGRRALAHPYPDAVIDGPDQVYSLLGPRWRGLAQEVFAVIGLSARNTVIVCAEVARGSASSVAVHPREVFRPLVRNGAVSAVVAHNHPSGDPTPSHDDLLLTERLRGVGELLGVPLLDHIVIGSDGYVSIAETWAELGEPTGLTEGDEALDAAACDSVAFLPPRLGAP